ncbi:chemotaxis protein MotB [Hoeflea marina]|uniref:Chemotaxis protein MotB n=1 Tax=Hoeflea marina TaxID=274592 RepID=A0A317PC34_9HYPH|nr:MotB family protein [Hoeflea marina]PWV95246.1 chemotaxis protein MotB [Hoeflea marina]
MSDETIHQGKNEIIIVKRRHGDHDEGGHGGAWKIAYADFMTAMMAFFLVMWLVNAANEETKASVASYFNPIKLMDEKPSERGIKQVGNSAEGEATAPKSESVGEAPTSGPGAASGNKENSTAGEKTDYSEADYFENPYAVLAEIAQETGNQSNISAKGDGGAATSGPATGATGGEAYRDPFDPDFWSKSVEEERKQLEEAQTLVKAEGQPLNGAGPDNAAAQAPDSKSAEADQKPATSEAGKVQPDTVKAGSEADKATAEAADLAAEINREVGQGAIGKLAEGITVTPAEGGLLVSITDQLDMAMFNVGSAVPARDLVVAMEKIGEVLAKRPGSIAIRGHTDARPFANASDDNWRLSMARAHSALFMLVRGGIPEERIIQVSGFADKRLKDPANPLSEVNRRIEILVEAGGG